MKTEANTGTETQAVYDELLEIVNQCEEGGYSLSVCNYFCGFDITEETSCYIIGLIKKDLSERKI